MPLKLSVTMDTTLESLMLSEASGTGTWVFLKVKEGSLKAAFQGCYIIESCRRTVPMSRILWILPRTESFVQRIFKNAFGVSSAFLKNPPSYARILEPFFFFKVAWNLKTSYQGSILDLRNTPCCPLFFYFTISVATSLFLQDKTTVGYKRLTDNYILNNHTVCLDFLLALFHNT